MITTQSTPAGDNPWYEARFRARNFGKRYSQLMQIIYTMNITGKPITVVSMLSGSRDSFIRFAEHHGFIIEASDEIPWGRGAYQYTIKSIDCEWRKK